MTKMSILNTTVHSRSTENKVSALYYASRNSRKGYDMAFFPNKKILNTLKVENGINKTVPVQILDERGLF